MRCEEVMELMQRHLDHDLNDEEDKKLREHAETCPDCSDMLQRLEQLNEDLESLPKVTPSFSIVDSIMPKLLEIDAAASSDTQAAALEREADPVVIPMRGGRRERRSFRTPAWTAAAAAAVLLGVMIFNGLPKAFNDQAERSLNEAAGSSEASLYAADSAAMESATASEEAVTKKMDSTEEPAAAEVPEQTEKIAAFDDPNSPVSSTDNKVPAETTQDKGEVSRKDAAVAGPESGGEEEAAPSMDIADSPNEGTAAEEPVPVPPTEPAPEEVHGIAALPPEPSAGEETPSELQDGADPNQGIMGGFEPAPARTMALANEDSSLAAIVEARADGGFAVAVTDKDGLIVFASERAWPGDTSLRFNEWAGTVVTYTVSTPGGEQTFAIDVSAGTETEVLP